MPSVAEQIRLAREHQKMSVQQIADVMKVRGDQVRALDAGQYDTFPAPVYVRGFVRTYATLVKLNVPEVMAALDGELSALPRSKEKPGLRPGPPSLSSKALFAISQVNWTITLVILGASLVLFGSIAGYRSWHNRKLKDQQLDLGPGLYNSVGKNHGDTLALPVK